MNGCCMTMAYPLHFLSNYKCQSNFFGTSLHVRVVSNYILSIVLVITLKATKSCFSSHRVRSRIPLSCITKDAAMPGGRVNPKSSSVSHPPPHVINQSIRDCIESAMPSLSNFGSFSDSLNPSLMACSSKSPALSSFSPVVILGVIEF